MPTYIVFLGPPGAGKGTQAEIVSTKLGIPQVSTGDLFRAMKTQDTPLARQVRAIMNSGELVPDDVTVQMVQERLSEPDCKDGAIMDGFPRTTPQADAFTELLESKFSSEVRIVPLMSISEEEAVRRISGRRSCPVCKSVYHVEFKPPKRAEICDNEGSSLEQREDDKPETVRERYRVYIENTEALIKYYRSRDILVEVDATLDIKNVTEQLIAAIRERV